MIKLGLTGNIGSGKTTISKIFESLGIPVFYADTQAKELYKEENIKIKIVSVFGNSVLTNSQIDLKALANIVFNNKTKLSLLTDIIHPEVHKKYNIWLSKLQDFPYTIHESAILFEYSQQHNYSKTICVIAPYKLRLERVMQRDNSTLEQVEERINNQMLESDKAKMSDYIITNDEVSFLIPQVLEIHQKFK